MILVDVEFFGIIVLHNKSFGASVCIYELNAFKSSKKTDFNEHVYMIGNSLHKLSFYIEIPVLFVLSIY